MRSEPSKQESSDLRPADGVNLAAPARPRTTGRTRLSGLWVSVIVGVAIFTLLLVFVIQNSKTVRVSFLFVHGHMPLGVALLLAATGGALLAALVMSLRIMQLRHRLHAARTSLTPSGP